jgi:tetratricopeptide (TPR) repeat protein
VAKGGIGGKGNQGQEGTSVNEEEEFDLLELEILNLRMAITSMSMASIHASEGKIEAAIEEYTRVLQYDPHLYLAYLRRGRLFWSKGDLAKAMEDLSRAVSLEPGAAYTYVLRGDLYWEMGDLESARRDYAKALELSPEYHEALKRKRRLEDKGTGHDRKA